MLGCACLNCVLVQAGPAYAEAFLTVLRNVTKEDTVQYVLALLDDLLQGGCWSLCSASHAASCLEDAFLPDADTLKGFPYARTRSGPQPSRSVPQAERCAQGDRAGSLHHLPQVVQRSHLCAA